MNFPAKVIAMTDYNHRAMPAGCIAAVLVLSTP